MLSFITPRRALWLLLLVPLATIIGAWIFEYAGYAPCELCLKQRWTYYGGVPVAAVLLAFAGQSKSWVRWGLALLAIIWLASMVFGIYHSGVEWKWWPGPSTCGSTGGLGEGLPDLTKKVVLCTEAAIRIFGLSLAGWNAVISAGLAAVALSGFRRYGSSSVSQ